MTQANLKINSHTQPLPSIAIIGAGWAGSAAALTLVRAGARVTVFEAAKIPGGRARSVAVQGYELDNGQHLLIGAYQRSLAMIASLHSDVNAALQRMPLQLITSANSPNPLYLQAPESRFIPQPLCIGWALLTAEGLSFADKFAAIRWCARTLSSARREDTTVDTLIKNQPPRVQNLLWAPLCIAALNTPIETASAHVFIKVLIRTFKGVNAASDLIIPRLNLSALLPEPALKEVIDNGGEVHLGAPVISINENGVIVVRINGETVERSFDQIIIATGPQHVPRLISPLQAPAAKLLSTALTAITYEPITTLSFDFLTLGSGIDVNAYAIRMLDGEPGQWCFAKRLSNGQVRVNVVISAHRRGEPDETALLAATLTQLRKSFAIGTPLWQQVITEKRATYACTPSISAAFCALPHQIGRIHFAGDWCVPELPATLEAAVMSGERAAARLFQNL